MRQGEALGPGTVRACSGHLPASMIQLMEAAAPMAWVLQAATAAQVNPRTQQRQLAATQATLRMRPEGLAVPAALVTSGRMRIG